MSFSLRQFSGIFRIRDTAGQPYILIGGQAVNFWAERYLSSEPELESLQPFTSQDIDFKGGTEDVLLVNGGIEAPVEVVQRFEGAKISSLGATVDLAFLPDVEFVLADEF